MTNSKKCSKCKKIKDLCDFYKRKSKPDSWCKECYKKYYKINKEKIKESRKKYWKKNKKKLKKYKKKWKKENPEYYKKYNKEYSKNNKDKINKRRRKYRKNNKDKINKYKRKYRNNKFKIDIHFRLRHGISSLISTRLKRRLLSKNNKSTFSFLPYTTDDLIKHLEKQFTKGMSWDNYGQWHIDHIKPDSLFNYKSVEDKEFQECWALKNLQPLWAEDNLSKGNKY